MPSVFINRRKQAAERAAAAAFAIAVCVAIAAASFDRPAVVAATAYTVAAAATASAVAAEYVSLIRDVAENSRSGPFFRESLHLLQGFATRHQTPQTGIYHLGQPFPTHLLPLLLGRLCSDFSRRHHLSESDTCNAGIEK